MIPVPELTKVQEIYGNIDYLPLWDDIPKEFKDFNSKNQWLKAQNDWFYNGIRMEQLVAKEGVDKNKALRALMAIQGSYKPSHEHKMAGVAYLMSEWFKEYKN